MVNNKSDSSNHYWYLGIASTATLLAIDGIAGALADFDLFYFLGGVVGLSLISWILVGFERIQAAYICWVIMLAFVATSRLSLLG